jgi:hypothetical protein
MIELISNGINLAGSLASMYSVASGYSLEKNIRQIQDSLRRLEDLQSQLLNRSRIGGTALNDLLALIGSFKDLKNPVHQTSVIRTMEDYARQVQRDRSLLDCAMDEMRRMVDAVRYTETAPIQMPRNMVRELILNPYDAGVTQFWNISNGGLWVQDCPRIMNVNLTPITWGNPLTGEMFLGEIPIQRLGAFGLRFRVPTYKHVIDGHVFSDRHGLYLPIGLAAL